MALGFFTKIPLPKNVDFEKVKQGEATLFLPVVGLIVGAFSALMFIGSIFLFPLPVAVAFSLIASLYITSAFHEDGLADMIDGFGGGWTKERILEIMKDSSIGTYGVIALVCSIGLKYLVLVNIPIEIIPITIIAGHTFSRSMAVSLMYNLNYSRTGNSKSQSVIKKLSAKEMLSVILFGVLTFFLFNNHFIFLIILPSVIVRGYLFSLYKKWIDGYTGDCIGAAQQIFEVVFLLSVSAIYNLNLIRNLY